jgi:hypothetical protein
MRPSVRSFAASLIAAAVVAAGCGGGSVVDKVGGSTRGAASGTNLVLSGSFSGSGPQLLAYARRSRSGAHRPMADTFDHILVQGTLYPGDAGDGIVTNSTNISVPTNGIYNASIPFSNVPVHSNEWGLLQFIGVAADGSQIPIGELAGLIDVTASPANSSTVTLATTQTFQVFTTLLTNGAIGTDDLDKTPTLDTKLATDVSATGIKVDPTTELYDANALVTLYQDIAPKFERDVTVNTSPAISGAFVFLRDYTNASELYLTSNLTNFFSADPLNVPPPVNGDVLGGSTAGCGSFAAAAPLQAPGTGPPPVPSLVNTCIINGDGSTTLLRNVYGGNVLIGATTDNYLGSGTPFNGGYASFAGHVPGAFSVTVPTASTQLSIAVDDPAGFAFGTTYFRRPPVQPFYVQPAFGNAPLSGTVFSAPAVAANRIIIPLPFNQSSNTLTVDSFNPWDISAADEQICGGIDCYGFSAKQPLAIMRLFGDNGTALTYFNWTPGGTATAISQITPSGYKVTISGAGTATLTTTTASVLLPRQIVTITGDWQGELPNTWTVTAHDAKGDMYVNSGPGAGAEGIDSAGIGMSSVADTTITTTITISFTTTVAGTITIGSL